MFVFILPFNAKKVKINACVVVFFLFLVFFFPLEIVGRISARRGEARRDL